ncbi:MAG: hypothetical protein PHX60_10665 [Giesbergeria sp.]|uniref:hypothetical protein n=1 Tax=Giesbergeria sp. TaxID=2818473 RepID=UPI00262A926A|nr:hypothetical protein [Giesbergeria sp.]MDD2610136.1 hypothetical protein [Giesbergeria sp.]
MSNPSPLLPAIAPASGGALTNPTGPQRIAARMAEDLLSVARSQDSRSIGLDVPCGRNTGFSMGLSFDEEIYKKAKPLFQQAIANLGNPNSDLKEAMRAVVQLVVDKFGTEAAQNMKPYVVRFISERQSPIM